MTDPPPDPERPKPVSETDPTRIGEAPSHSGAESHPAERSTFNIRYSDHPAAPGEMPKAFGRYQVQGVLGRGGFGTVYVGYDSELGRRVAIKVSRTQLSPDARDATVREARRLARLQHPSIVAVHDIGVQDEHVYIVTSFVEGDNLHRWLASHTPPPHQSAEIAATVADALHHAHQQRIVHRDVKPSNIMIKPDGQPILLDFGIARGDFETVEQGAGISGTPGYLSPEQAQGFLHQVGPRSDIFSLGVVLYRMLCGRPAYDGPGTLDLVRQVIETDPTPPRRRAPEVSEELEGVCLKALARSPEDRFASAREFAEALRHAVRPRAAPTVVPPAPVGAAREAERRNVTLLLCGCALADPAASLDLLDPEEQHALLRDFERLCTAQAARFGGAAVPSGERELLVCFGFPVAHEDAGLRAARTGLAVLDATPRLEGSHPLVAWVVVHTGEAVVGAGGAERLSVVGEARTVLARLGPLTEPGALFMTEATERLTRGFLVCAEAGRHPLKGVPKPVALFRVTGEGPARNPLEARERTTGLSPLVGRDTELSILRDRWEQTAEGFGQVVLLVGEAGLGKSRLVRELKGHVAQQEATVPLSVVEWRCSPYRQSSSLRPATDFFARLLRFVPEEPARARLDRLIAHLGELQLGSSETVALLAGLLSIPLDDRYPPLNLSPQRQKDKTREVLFDWLRACAKRHPLLFIVEDLHWIDPSTLELLELLIEEGVGDRMLTVLTFRPEFETPWKSRANLTQIALNRLTRRQVTVMLGRQMGLAQIPAALVEAVFARTEGVPLFVEEFAKVLVESPAFRTESADSSDAVAQLLRDIPATLHDLLLARLDRMASNREVIQVAATLGREFGYEQLQAACTLDERLLQQELDKLVRAELLFQKGRPPRGRYLFKHALIQDAAYRSMLKAKRQQHHRRIAEVLTSRFPETVETEPELIAHHYTEAGLAAPAIDFWKKAGLRAQQRSAVTEAIGHFTQALALVETLPAAADRDRLELELQLPLGAVLTQKKGYAAAEVGAVMERARLLCERAGQTSHLFFALRGMYAWRVVRGELREALDLGRAILDLTHAQLAHTYLTEAHFTMGCAHYFRGEFEAARSHTEAGFTCAEPEACRFLARHIGQNAAVTHQIYWSVTLWHLGQPAQALDRGRRAVALARELNDPFSLAHALNHLSWVEHFCRLGAPARTSAEACLRIADEQGFVFWRACALLSRGAALILEGNVPAGIDEVLRGRAAFQATGAQLLFTHWSAMLADAYRRAGRLDEAARAAEEGIAQAEATYVRYVEAELLRLKGEALLAGGDAAGAEGAFRRAIELARVQQARAWELRAMLSLGRLLRGTDRWAEARLVLSGVVDTFTEGFDLPDLAEARALLAEGG